MLQAVRFGVDSSAQPELLIAELIAVPLTAMRLGSALSRACRSAL